MTIIRRLPPARAKLVPFGVDLTGLYLQANVDTLDPPETYELKLIRLDLATDTFEHLPMPPTVDEAGDSGAVVGSGSSGAILLVGFVGFESFVFRSEQVPPASPNDWSVADVFGDGGSDVGEAYLATDGEVVVGVAGPPVGEGFRSSDYGASWTSEALPSYATHAGKTPNRIAWSNGRFYRWVFDSGSVRASFEFEWSTDGLAWTTIVASASNRLVRQVAYLGDGDWMFVAGTSAGDGLVTSDDDGATWTVRTEVEAGLSDAQGFQVVAATETAGVGIAVEEDDAIGQPVDESVAWSSASGFVGPLGLGPHPLTRQPPEEFWEITSFFFSPVTQAGQVALAHNDSFVGVWSNGGTTYRDVLVGGAWFWDESGGTEFYKADTFPACMFGHPNP